MPPDTGSDNGNWIKRMTPLAIRNLAQRGSIPLFLGVGLPLFLLNGISRQPPDNGKGVGFNLHCFIRHSLLYSYLWIRQRHQQSCFLWLLSAFCWSSHISIKLTALLKGRSLTNPYYTEWTCETFCWSYSHSYLQDWGVLCLC